jgi:tetratricopeptide (TPR) repeat protein
MNAAPGSELEAQSPAPQAQGGARVRSLVSGAWSLALGAIVAGLVLSQPLPAAAQPERQRAVDTFNAANKAYAASQYEVAAPLYEQVVVALPDQPIAFLYLGNCYDHMASNAPRGSRELTLLLKKAEQAYRAGAEKLLAMNQPGATKNAITVLEMLASLYAPDRLHDPAAARTVTEQLIRLVPDDPAYEFSLARLEENAEQYDAAEAALAKAAALAPGDAKVYAELAGHYWDIAAHGSRMTPPREAAYLNKGMAAADKALSMAPDNRDAMSYKGQIIREQAALETDKKKKDALIKEADMWAAKAKTLR